MLVTIPVVHGFEALQRLRDRKLGTLRQNVQLRIGDQRGDFKNRIGVRIEAGHLQVNPNQVIAIGNHGQNTVPALLNECLSVAGLLQ